MAFFLPSPRICIGTTGRQRALSGALAGTVWTELWRGGFTVVDREERNGRWALLVRRSLGHSRERETLSRRELQVLAYAQAGHASKLIAFDLDLAQSTVSRHLRSGMKKLGIRHRCELARWGITEPQESPSSERVVGAAFTRADASAGWRGLTSAPPTGLEGVLGRREGVTHIVLSVPVDPPKLPSSLTLSERAAVVLALEGRRTTDIAEARGVRPRTISNQLQSAYRKLGVASRFELAALVAPV